MLCLASRRSDMYLLRETVEFNNKIHTGFKFLFMDIDRLKSHLLEEVCDRLGQYNLSDNEKLKIIDDYFFHSYWVMTLLHILFLLIYTMVDLTFFLIYMVKKTELKSNLVDLEKKKSTMIF